MIVHQVRSVDCQRTNRVRLWVLMPRVVIVRTFSLQTSGFCRLSTPIFPIMDNMMMDTFYFSVPNRILWDNWVKMMGEQTNPGDSTDFITPVIEMLLPNDEGSLADYFGLPIQQDGYSISALPLRAYYKIHNEWFRDQNLQDSVDELKICPVSLLTRHIA